MGIADDQDAVPSRSRLLGQLLNSIQKWAGADDEVESTPLESSAYLRADAVGTDDDGRARLNVRKIFHNADAALLKLSDDLLVVDDRTEVNLTRRVQASRRLDGLLDAWTESCRRTDFNLHDWQSSPG